MIRKLERKDAAKAAKLAPPYLEEGLWPTLEEQASAARMAEASMAALLAEVWPRHFLALPAAPQ